MNFRTSLLIFFSLLSSISFYAQNVDDTTQTVTIFADKQIKKTFTDLSSVKVFSLKEAPQAQVQTLDEFIFQNSSVFIKKLGVNALTTLSLRGASSTQSLVLWEGMPIQNTMNGATDISLFNAGLFEAISIDFDGNSALYGSGNVGGAMHLNSNFSNSNANFTAGTRFGSFRSLDIYSKLFSNNNNNKFYLKAFYTTAENNFKYTHQNMSKRISHAQKESFSLLGGWNKVFSTSVGYVDVNYHTWMQKNDRNIPPALFEPFSTKTQYEFSWRHLVKASTDAIPHHTLYAQAGWMADVHRFSDSVAFLDQHLNAHTINSELGLKNKETFLFKDFKLDYLIILPSSKQYLKNINILNSFSNHYFGLAANAQIIYKEKLYLQLNARQEFASDYKVPFLYGGKIAYHFQGFPAFKFYHLIHVFSSYQKSFRAPLLHELHQFPGGNIHLTPEHGQNSEFGLKSYHISDNGVFNLQSQFVYFRRHIYDWIYWLGATIWTPYNIAEVSTHGWDLQLKNAVKLNDNQLIEFNIDHIYTIATTAHSHLPNNNSIGKQIPYTPRYNTRINFSYGYKESKLHLGAAYTGYVFTSLDESAYLLPYTIYNASISTTLYKLRNYKISSVIYVNNFTNRTYFTIQNRPQPGREISISFHLIPL